MEKKQYIRLTREDAENYLKQLKDIPDLSINDFARTKEKVKYQSYTSEINKYLTGKFNNDALNR